MEIIRWRNRRTTLLLIAMDFTMMTIGFPVIGLYPLALSLADVLMSNDCQNELLLLDSITTISEVGNSDSPSIQGFVERADLAIIAGEQREHGTGIADAICARIIKVDDSFRADYVKIYYDPTDLISKQKTTVDATPTNTGCCPFQKQA